MYNIIFGYYLWIRSLESTHHIYKLIITDIFRIYYDFYHKITSNMGSAENQGLMNKYIVLVLVYSPVLTPSDWDRYAELLFIPDTLRSFQDLEIQGSILFGFMALYCILPKQSWNRLRVFWGFLMILQLSSVICTRWSKCSYILSII